MSHDHAEEQLARLMGYLESDPDNANLLAIVRAPRLLRMTRNWLQVCSCGLTGWHR